MQFCMCAMLAISMGFAKNAAERNGLSWDLNVETVFYRYLFLIHKGLLTLEALL